MTEPSLFYQSENNGPLLLLSLVLLALFFFLLGLRLSQYLDHLETKKPFAELPMPPKSHWLFGHVQIVYGENFPAQVYQIMKESANANGHTGYWLLNKKTLSVLDVQDARTILLKESSRTTVPIISHYIIHIIGPKALILMNGREWKLHRDAITRTFVPAFLQEAQQQFHQVARDLVTSIRKKIDQTGTQHWQVDVQPILKLCTMDCFGKAAFGTDLKGCKTLQASPIVQAFEYLTIDLSERLGSPLLPWNYFYGWPTAKNKRQREQFYFLRNYIQTLLTRAKKDNSQKGNLLTRLVAAHESKESNSDAALDEALKDVLSTLLFAGYDTTSTTLMFALYLLAIHPDIQDRCLEELQPLDETDLANPDKLPYTAAVVKETLRLYPPGFQTSRTLTKDISLSGGFVAPKGTHIGIPIWVIQRDASIFPHPEECRPERWVAKVDGSWVERTYTKEESSTTNGSIPAGNPDALLAFSAGGRSCPGAKFAVQEAVLVLANLVKDLKFKPVPGFELKLKLQGILPYPEDGMPLRIEKR